jgi:ABC-type Zn uptake system ZnuABC Zn-binding protein ZnuA
MPKPIDDSKKKYIITNVAELKETLNKLAKSYNEILEFLKQAQEQLEKD